ncbi:MAG: hypothetical protein Q7S22_06865 [Candidatus Micrarchaeota archaeon]|nr:hypothetical protein [Candidatus Micrarchaeota archaeon]
MSLSVSNQHPAKWKTYVKAPFVTVAKAYFVADDFVYNRVTEFAKGAEIVSTKVTRGKFVLDKRRFCHASIIVTGVGASLGAYPHSKDSSDFFIFAGTTTMFYLLVFKPAINIFFGKSTLEMFKDPVSHDKMKFYFSLIRLALSLAIVRDFKLDNTSDNYGGFLADIFLLGIFPTYYLVTEDSKKIARFRNWLNTQWTETKELFYSQDPST